MIFSVLVVGYGSVPGREPRDGVRRHRWEEVGAATGGWEEEAEAGEAEVVRGVVLAVVVEGLT